MSVPSTGWAPPRNLQGFSLPAAVPGSWVSLVPIRGSEVSAVTGRLEEWFPSPSGLTVFATVVVDALAAESLSGDAVWCCFVLPGGALMLVSAVAESGRHSPGRLVLTGVRMLAHETQRAAFRARIQRHVKVYADGGASHMATSVDVSRGGCRLELADAAEFVPGERVSVELDLAPNFRLHVTGRVLRTDLSRLEIAVRFVSLSDADAARVEGLVFSELTGRLSALDPADSLYG